MKEMNEDKTCQWSGSINLFILGAYKGFVFFQHFIFKMVVYTTSMLFLKCTKR